MLVGTKLSQIATLVERHTCFTLLVKTPARDSCSVADALSRAIGKLPTPLRGSLTWDRGSETAAHQRFTIATDVRVSFCDPYSPWQRGSKVARELNQRPRKIPGFLPAADKLTQALQ